MPTLQALKVPIEIVLRNLIGNALKHHDRADGRLEISGRDLGDRVEFIVVDDGPGIAQLKTQAGYDFFKWCSW